MRRYYLLLLLLIILKVHAQEKQLWMQLREETNSAIGRTGLKSYNVYYLNQQLFTGSFAAISKKTASLKSVEFPDSDGNISTYVIKPSQVLHPDLSKRYPEIQTYIGWKNNNRATTIHITITTRGMYAMILSPEKGTVFIEPLDILKATYKVFSIKDRIGYSDFQCFTKETELEKSLNPATKVGGDLKLRTYRLALAATEEYSNYHINLAGLGAGSTRQDSISVVLSAMAVTMTRVNGIYQRDLAITMQLVPDNDKIIFLQTDPGDDPYTNDNINLLITENQPVINNMIGFSNYDIGHVFSTTTSGGKAEISSVCTYKKAMGSTTVSATYCASNWPL